LFVAGAARIMRLSQPDRQGFYMKYDLLVDDLPENGQDAPVLLFTPDWSSLFVSSATPSSGREFAAQDPRRGVILRYNPDGRDGQVYASGLSTVGGMAFRLDKDELWVISSERSVPGDNRSLDGLYRIQTGDYVDCSPGSAPGSSVDCGGELQLVGELPAYSAPLGLEFYNGERSPRRIGTACCCLHGSWRR
jgi:glucose/arabinose dehydrogenase